VGYCEPKPLYLALLGILERSGRWPLAGEVWRTATKKFNTSCKVSACSWLRLQHVLLVAVQMAAGWRGVVHGNCEVNTSCKVHASFSCTTTQTW
jgi:hypothetical protein